MSNKIKLSTSEKALLMGAGPLSLLMAIAAVVVG